MQERFLTAQETAERVSHHTRTIRQMVADGTFPKPVQLSKQRIAFLESEVAAWMREKVRQSEKPLPATLSPPMGAGTFCGDEY